MNINKNKAISKQGMIALTGVVAATSISQAATVQITLTGNQIVSGSNTLNADLTGDSIADITFVGIPQVGSFNVQVNINGSIDAFARYTSALENYRVDAGAGTSVVGPAPGAPLSTIALNPITFTDAAINSGAVTTGFLEISARNIDVLNQEVTLTRLIFDDASVTAPSGVNAGDPAFSEFTPVPEPSSLALLALGAGGILTRRQRKKAYASA